MKPAKLKLTIYQGATFRKLFAWKAGGQPVDLTGWKARMQIRPAAGSATLIAELTTENGGIVLLAQSGEFYLELSAELTAALNFDEAVYDLEMVAPSGEVTRLIYGAVVFSPEVTV